MSTGKRVSGCCDGACVRDCYMRACTYACKQVHLRVKVSATFLDPAQLDSCEKKTVTRVRVCVCVRMHVSGVCCVQKKRVYTYRLPTHTSCVHHLIACARCSWLGHCAHCGVVQCLQHLLALRHHSPKVALACVCVSSTKKMAVVCTRVLVCDTKDNNCFACSPLLLHSTIVKIPSKSYFSKVKKKNTK